MLVGWELPLSHCVIVSVGKGIDRAHGTAEKTKKQVRLALTWALLARQVVASMEEGGYVMCLGLAVSYFLLCRASELWTYATVKSMSSFVRRGTALLSVTEGCRWRSRTDRPPQQCR